MALATLHYLQHQGNDAVSFQPTAPPQNDTRPKIGLISLDYELRPVFSSVFAPMLQNLDRKAALTHVTSKQEFMTYLTDAKPSAIIITDPYMAKEVDDEVIDKLKHYILYGGTAIFGGLFGHFVNHVKMDEFWGDKLRLPWKKGGYMQTPLKLNPGAAPDLDLSKCHVSCNLKPCFLTGVLKRNVLYLPRIGALIDSRQAPMVWSEYGDGHIGFIGDSNGEEESCKVLLAMCKIPVFDGEKVGAQDGDTFILTFDGERGFVNVPA